MTVQSQRSSQAGRDKSGVIALLLIAASAGAIPNQAKAQIAFEAAVQTDYRLRGYSLSNGHPVASVAIGYDDPTGLYAGGLIAGMIWDGDPALLMIEGHGGYAVRIAPGVSIDVGGSHSQYYFGYGTSRDYQYSEGYVGVALSHVSARIGYSPNYYFPATPTLYTEINGSLEPAPSWFLSAHAGALVYLKGAPYALPDERLDWRLGGSHQVGPYGLHVDVSGRVQGEHSLFATDRIAVTAAVTRVF